MYCIKCGKENADDAVYCQKCGTLLEAEAETWVAKRDHPAAEAAAPLLKPGGEQESRIFSITPTLKFVIAGYVVAVLSAFVAVGLLTIFVSGFEPWIGVAAGLLLLLIPAYFHVRQKLVKYTLTDTTIEIDRGFISRTTQNIPLRRIQDVTVSATILQRILGFGDIVVDNAGEDGGKVVLDNIDSPRKYADILLKQMRRLDK